MATVLIIGDGPGGLSAALFLAKNGHTVHVFGKNATPMHKARLLNYLGVKDMAGSDFQQLAREQVSDAGGTLHDSEVASARAVDQGFRLETTQGEQFTGDYLVLAAGAKSKLVSELGLATDDNGFVVTDRESTTNVPKVYAVGWSARPDKIQAIISAGDGAAAALDILSRVKGKPFHDFDVV